MRVPLLCLLLFAPQDPATLVERLKDDDPRVRDEASRALRALETSALPVLRAAADDPDAELRARVRALVHGIEYDAVLDPALLARYPGIREAFLDGDHERLVRLLLVRGSPLWRFGGEGEAYAIQLLSHPDLGVRKLGFCLLSVESPIPRRPTSALVREICRWTPEAAEDPRCEWLSNLSSRLYDLASPLDRNLLSSARPGHPRAEGLLSVVRARCGIPAAVDELPRLVVSDSKQVSSLALRCVGDLRYVAARQQVLCQLRGDALPLAAQAIVQIEDESCRRDYAQLWRETPPKARTADHVRLLARSGDPDTTTILCGLLEGPESLAVEAAGGLAALKHHGAVDRLLALSVPAALCPHFLRAAAAIVDADDVVKLVEWSAPDEYLRNQMRFLLVTHPDLRVRRCLAELLGREQRPAVRDRLFEVVYGFKDDPGILECIPVTTLETTVLAATDWTRGAAAELLCRKNRVVADAFFEKAVLAHGEKQILLLAFLREHPSEALTRAAMSWKEGPYTASIVVPYLENAGSPEAKSALERFSKSENPPLQASALAALARLRGVSKGEAGPLIRHDPWDRLSERLAENEPGARDEVRAIMKSGSAWFFVPVLKDWADPEMIPALQEGLRQWDAGLADRVSKEGIPGPCILVGHEPDGSDCMRALAATGDRSLAAMFVERLTDPDEGVRQVAMETVGRWRVQKAVPVLQHLVRAAGPSVRADALKSLAMIGAPGTREFLLEVLRDNPHAAPLALARLRATEAAGAIARLLEDSGPHSVVVTALDLLQHPEAYVQIDRLLPRSMPSTPNAGWPDLEKLLLFPVRNPVPHLVPYGFPSDRTIRDALERCAGMNDLSSQRHDPCLEDRRLVVQVRNGALEAMTVGAARASWKERYGIR